MEPMNILAALTLNPNYEAAPHKQRRETKKRAKRVQGSGFRVYRDFEFGV